MTPGNRYTNTIVMDNGLIYSEWAREVFSLSIGGLAISNSEALA